MEKQDILERIDTIELHRKSIEGCLEQIKKQEYLELMQEFCQQAIDFIAVQKREIETLKEAVQKE